MVETYTEEEKQRFETGQEVGIQQLREIVAPTNTLDCVEEKRLRMIGGHVNELLKPGLPASEASIHRAYLGHLGANAVLEYLPEV